MAELNTPVRSLVYVKRGSFSPLNSCEPGDCYVLIDELRDKVEHGISFLGLRFGDSVCASSDKIRQ